MEGGRATGRRRGAVPVPVSLELLGDGGTGHWEPQGLWMAGGVVRRRPCLRCGGDDAVAARGVVLDASLAHECGEEGGDGGVPGRGALADLALGEGLFGIHEHLDDALFGGFGVRRIVVGGVVTQPQGGPLAVIGELERDIVEAGGGPVLDGHDDVSLSSAQVEVAVAPGMEQGIQLHLLEALRGAPFR